MHRQLMSHAIPFYVTKARFALEILLHRSLDSLDPFAIHIGIADDVAKHGAIRINPAGGTLEGDAVPLLDRLQFFPERARDFERDVLFQAGVKLFALELFQHFVAVEIEGLGQDGEESIDVLDQAGIDRHSLVRHIVRENSFAGVDDGTALGRDADLNQEALGVPD